MPPENNTQRSVLRPLSLTPAPVVHARGKDRRREKPGPIQTPIPKDKNQENDPKTSPSPSTQSNREEQAGPSKVTQGLIRPKIKEVLQTELRKKDQIKSAIVALCQYSIAKRKSDDTSKLAEVEKYHRGNMRPILLEGDIEEHITKTIRKIDVQIEETLKKRSGYILKRILEISIETYTLRRALGGSYIPTPKKLANTKSTINPDHQGLINPETNRPSERCLQGVLSAYFAYQDGHTDHLERIFRAKKYKPYLDIVKLDGIPMSTPICSHIFDKIEKMNPDISISVWRWNEELATPKAVIASKNFKRKHKIQLLALTDIIKSEDGDKYGQKNHFL
ncbi:hypothetical protein RclHR1_17230005 [Rhizophagus clarus]|uniref:Uncharacterized protein n=1 Tax=Rhizophagus clarus TaxID=94130 RepID=A0A2Z6QYH4_9GLOM|nr:hypothetical protein RclHR1_17230005 [Rhizophagus clarus]